MHRTGATARAAGAAARREVHDENGDESMPGRKNEEPKSTGRKTGKEYETMKPSSK